MAYKGTLTEHKHQGRVLQKGSKREIFLRLLQGQDMQTLSSKQLYRAIPKWRILQTILPGKVKSCSPFKISQLKAYRKYYTTNVDVPKNLKIIGPRLGAQSVHENTTFVEAVPHWFLTCEICQSLAFLRGKELRYSHLHHKSTRLIWIYFTKAIKPCIKLIIIL